MLYVNCVYVCVCVLLVVSLENPDYHRYLYINNKFTVFSNYDREIPPNWTRGHGQEKPRKG